MTDSGSMLTTTNRRQGIIQNYFVTLVTSLKLQWNSIRTFVHI